MRKILFLVSLICLSFFVQAQHPLTVSPSQINFGAVYDNAPASQTVTFTNASSIPITVDSVFNYKNYRSYGFRVSDSSFVVPANGTKTITVYFEPKQNMPYNSELLFHNSSKRGFVSLDLQGQGKFALSYYSTTENLEGEPLKAALRTRLNLNYVNLGYSGPGSARIKMFETIDNWQVNGRDPNLTTNKTECVYTGRQITQYPINTGTLNNAPYSMNTEHTWPQSLGANNDPMQSDIHHLYPVDNTANTIRSNDPYAVLSNWTWTQGGSRSNGSAFEPRDEQKGNVARSLLYFAIKYGGQAAVQLSFLAQQEATMRNWVVNYPVTPVNKKRNIDIAQLINARNPFIDYPQFLDRISSVAGTASVILNPSLSFVDTLCDFGNLTAGTSATYNYVLMNDGRAVVNLTSFAVSGTGFSLGSSVPASIALNPGDVAIIPIQFTSTGTAANGTLTYATDIPVVPTVATSLIANGSVATLELPLQNASIQVYPSPSNTPNVFVAHEATINSVPADFTVVDAFGRKISCRVDIMDAQRMILEVETLPAGVYFISFSDKKSGKRYQGHFVR